MRLSQMYPSSGGVSLWCVSQKHIKVCFRHVSVDACIYFGPFSTAEVSLMKARALLTADADFSRGLRSL